jgi:hypothetical protein
MKGIFSVMSRIVVTFCSIPLSYFPCFDSCGCPISRCAIFALMFRAARVAVLLILGFLFWILYVVMPWIIRQHQHRDHRYHRSIGCPTAKT